MNAFLTRILLVTDAILAARVRGACERVNAFPTNILLATDGSTDATLAARVAADISKGTGSELHVVHVRIPLYSPALYEGYYEGVDVGAYLQDESEELTRRGEGLLDEQVRSKPLEAVWHKPISE